MRLARTQCLNVDELYDSMCTVIWVVEAVDDRHEDLAGMFPVRYVYAIELTAPSSTVQTTEARSCTTVQNLCFRNGMSLSHSDL